MQRDNQRAAQVREPWIVILHRQLYHHDWCLPVEILGDAKSEIRGRSHPLQS